MTTQAGEQGGPALRVGGLGARLRVPDLRRNGRLWNEVAAAAALFCLWLVCRPFLGLTHDSRVYIGRAMADLDPQGVGRDLMFAEVGQARFSLYTGLARATVQAVGPVQAAVLLGVFGAAVWFLGLWALVRRLAEPRLGFAMLAFAAALPSTYGGLGVFQFGESFATPRVLAEAAVLGGLAFLLDRRLMLAALLLVVAALFHPIMAGGGFGVALLILAREDRRWLWIPALGGAAALAAAALRLPVLDRLFVRLDPEWLEPVRARNPYLFLAQWKAADWGLLAVQTATVLTAATLLKGRARGLMKAGLVVGALALLATALLGDGLKDLLVLQLQPWRALWLVALLACTGMAVCATSLARGGERDRIALALLTLGWLAIDAPPLAGAAAIAALALRSRRARSWADGRVRPWMTWAAWSAVAVFALGWYVYQLARFGPALAAKPDALHLGFAPVRNLRLHAIPLALLAWWAASVQPERVRRAAPVLLGAAAVALGWSAWASWGELVALAVKGGGGAPRSLIEMLAARPGEVLWVGGDTEAWRLAGRAAWVNDIQGASIVFSREQALRWRERSERLIRLGLAKPSLENPWRDKPERIVNPTTQQLAAFCRSPDAPAWVISPVPDGLPPPELPDTRLWRGPGAQYRLELHGTRYVWRRIQSYAVAPCRADPPAAS